MAFVFDPIEVTSEARSAAIAAGSNTYKGPPCLHGHDGLRYVTNYRCVTCARGSHEGRKTDTGSNEQVTWGGPYPALMNFGKK